MTDWTEESDSELDMWMNDHPANPASKVTADKARHWLLNSCPTCLCDPCQCLPDPTNAGQRRHEDQFSYEQFRDAQGRLT